VTAPPLPVSEWFFPRAWIRLEVTEVRLPQGEPPPRAVPVRARAPGQQVILPERGY
jgi:hypothetical protein